MIARRARLALAAALLLATPAPASAETFPARPVRLLVPYAAGGGTDLLARVVAQKLGAAWGQQVLVDNRTGANGRVASEATARAAPDGYTLLVVSAAHAVNAGLHRDLPYDSVADFTPVGLWTTAPYVLVTGARTPIDSVPGLIAAAKASPGRLTYSSSGVGSGPHLSGELFRMMAGIDLVHVPYKGGGPEMVALLAGETTVSFASIASARPMLEAASLRALGVTTPGRARALPAVPPIAEAGLPGYDFTTWYGVLGPAGLEPALAASISRDMASAVRQPEVSARLVAEGFEPAPSDPAAFAALIRAEIDKYARIIRHAGARAE